ncbi:hypothetical protein GCM10028868_04130 [Virgibacillus kimchii]
MNSNFPKQKRKFYFYISAINAEWEEIMKFLIFSGKGCLFYLQPGNSFIKLNSCINGKISTLINAYVQEGG